MTHYDLVVIGTGSGNTIVDDRFAHLSVAIVERDTFGGTCLNRGCIPSKMLIHPADLADDAADGTRFGVATSYPGLDGADWPAIRDRVFGRIDPQASDGKDYREGLENVDVLTGTAAFTGPRTLEVELASGGRAQISGDHVVIATGTRPLLPPIDGLHDVPHHTSDTIMRIDALPRRLAIIGGGYVGAEMAHLFSGLGVDVVQIQRGPRLLLNHDDDVSELFTRLAAQRWEVRLDALVEAAEPLGDGAGARLRLSTGDQIDVDLVLVAAGRVPNSDQLDVGAAGIATDDSGLVVVDQHQRTTVDGVWALGDASSPQPLKHVANQDARVVQHNLLHPDDLLVSDHRFVPAAVFTSPQVASVGQTEREALEAGVDIAVATHAYADIAHGWALEEDDTGHFAKLLADRATGRLVGAHLIGPDASNLVQPLIMAMSFDLPVRGLARGQYWIHPALSEVVENALLALERELDAGD